MPSTIGVAEAATRSLATFTRTHPVPYPRSIVHSTARYCVAQRPGHARPWRPGTRQEVGPQLPAVGQAGSCDWLLALWWLIALRGLRHGEAGALQMDGPRPGGT